MIITDIAQIDRIAEETFGTSPGYISVDMRDYAFIKEQSESLKAIKLEIQALTEDVVRSLEETIIEAGEENLSNLLLYVKGKGGDEGIQSITIEKFNLFIEVLMKHYKSSDIIWGMGEDNDCSDNISILIILGYGKKE